MQQHYGGLGRGPGLTIEDVDVVYFSGVKGGARFGSGQGCCRDQGRGEDTGEKDAFHGLGQCTARATADLRVDH